MAPPPPEVVQWLKKTYPHPTVDHEWLQGCYDWILDDLHLDPARDMAAILENVNTQLLGSDFADSMVAGTGIPHNVLGAVHAILKGPILVEITEIMETGHSAYSLLQIHESREEYCKQAALPDAGDQEERKPMPKFPRSMLQFQLSDGASVLPAIEIKNLPQFELGETPLGYKMVIKNVTIRRGTAFLEPKCVEVKGHRTAARDERRDFIFRRSLRLRLGEAVPEEDLPGEGVIDPAPVPLRATSPRALAHDLRHSPTPEVRSPLREISPPIPQAGPSNAVAMNLVERADDMAEPRRRKMPKSIALTSSPEPELQYSHYFAKPSGSSYTNRPSGSASPVVTVAEPGSRDAMREFARAIRLSPLRMPPIDVPASDDEEEPLAVSSRRTAGEGHGFKQKQKETVMREPSSDEYEFDDDIDDSFLEQVDRFEQEASKRTAQSQTQVATQTHVKMEIQSQIARPSAGTTAVDGSSNNTSNSSSGRASRAAFVPGTSSRFLKANSHRAEREDMDVINISDDEEEIDKENVPVPTRHVRQRIVNRPEEDIIELSDSTYCE